MNDTLVNFAKLAIAAPRSKKAKRFEVVLTNYIRPNKILGERHDLTSALNLVDTETKRLSAEGKTGHGSLVYARDRLTGRYHGA